MLKQMNSIYRAGIRGSNWLKLKREYQNDLGDSLRFSSQWAHFLEKGEEPENMGHY